jgi:RHS repeat-associated protein
MVHILDLVRLGGHWLGEGQVGILNQNSEVKGEGNEIDFGDRIYDPRLGIFQSLDPESKKYPSISNYSFAENNPIQFIDIDGRDCGDPPGLRQGKKGELKLGTSRSFGSVANVGIFARDWEVQAYNFSRLVGGNLDYKVIGTASEGDSPRVRLSSDNALFKTIMYRIEQVHGLKVSDFSSDELLELSSFKFTSKEGSDQLFSYNQSNTKLASIALPTSISAKGVLPLGAASSVTQLNASIDVIVEEKVQQVYRMSKKTGNQLMDDLPQDMEGLNSLRQEVKGRTVANNGKKSKEDIALEQKIKRQEKAIGARNAQKRASN